MKVYHLKNKSNKVKYDKKQEIENFLLNLDFVILKWERAPKSYFIIMDINENNENKIIEFINNKLNLDNFKTTKRDKEIFSKNLIKDFISYESLKPFYLNINNEELSEKINLINKQYDTNHKLEDF